MRDVHVIFPLKKKIYERKTALNKEVFVFG